MTRTSRGSARSRQSRTPSQNEDDERGHVAAVTNGMIAGHAYMEHDL